MSIPGIDADAANPFDYATTISQFVPAVNKLLEQRDLYDEEFFKDVPMISDELRDLRDRGLENLSEIQVKRFNRLLFEASFPDLVRSSPPTSIQFKYAWFKPIDPVPMRGEDFREALQGNLSGLMSWFVGAIGVIVAILVTSPIVPQMFDTGSLHLLLSKPVSRWMLFLAKFCGGCAFICICAAYLVVGLWLILGGRFGVWDPKFLLGIPIYVFVFAIYYAVSSLAGVVFRSPIVCVAVTVLFWLACFTVGGIKGIIERNVWQPARLTQVIEAGDSLMAVNEAGIPQQWDGNKWEEVFVSSDLQQARFIRMMTPDEVRSQFTPVGPIHDAKNDLLIGVHPAIQPPGSARLYAGKRDDDWSPESYNSAPTGTKALFQEPSGQVLFVSSVGIHRLTGDPLKDRKPVEVFGFARRNSDAASSALVNSAWTPCRTSVRIPSPIAIHNKAETP